MAHSLIPGINARTTYTICSLQQAKPCKLLRAGLSREESAGLVLNPKSIAWCFCLEQHLWAALEWRFRKLSPQGFTVPLKKKCLLYDLCYPRTMPFYQQSAHTSAKWSAIKSIRYPMEGSRDCNNQIAVQLLLRARMLWYRYTLLDLWC